MGLSLRWLRLPSLPSLPLWRLRLPLRWLCGRWLLLVVGFLPLVLSRGALAIAINEQINSVAGFDRRPGHFLFAPQRFARLASDDRVCFQKPINKLVARALHDSK